jgi:asparagine synthase (glutamine-hydrolysing)
VATHLSGGLDSSAITGLAASLLDNPGRLQAWSWMRPPEGTEETQDPEWSLAMEVARMWHVPLHFTPFSEADFLALLQQPPLEYNDSADLWYEFPVRQQLQQQGVQVILSGWGGDQFISNAGQGAYLEGLLSRRAVATLADLAALAGDAGRPGRAFLSLGRHQLAAPLRDYLRWRFGRERFNGWGDDGLQLTTPEFRQWAERSSKALNRLQPRLRLRDRQLQELAVGTVYNRVEAWAASGSRAGVEYRYPLLDRRIIEFALGMPPEHYRGAGESRRVFRGAVDPYLPGLLREGSIKFEPRRVQEAYDTITRALTRHLTESPPAPHACVDVKALQRAVAALPEPGTAVTAGALTALQNVKRATFVANLSVDLP